MPTSEQPETPRLGDDHHSTPKDITTATVAARREEPAVFEHMLRVQAHVISEVTHIGHATSREQRPPFSHPTQRANFLQLLREFRRACSRALLLQPTHESASKAVDAMFQWGVYCVIELVRKHPSAMRDAHEYASFLSEAAGSFSALVDGLTAIDGSRSRSRRGEDGGDIVPARLSSAQGFTSLRSPRIKRLLYRAYLKLGDLARYKAQHHKNQQERTLMQTSNWLAKRYYNLAVREAPASSGLPFNQLALIATQEKTSLFLAGYYYIRAAFATNPPHMARRNLQKFMLSVIPSAVEKGLRSNPSAAERIHFGLLTFACMNTALIPADQPLNVSLCEWLKHDAFRPFFSDILPRALRALSPSSNAAAVFPHQHKQASNGAHGAQGGHRSLQRLLAADWADARTLLLQAAVFPVVMLWECVAAQAKNSSAEQAAPRTTSSPSRTDHSNHDATTSDGADAARKGTSQDDRVSNFHQTSDSDQQQRRHRLLQVLEERCLEMYFDILAELLTLFLHTEGMSDILSAVHILLFMLVEQHEAVQFSSYSTHRIWKLLTETGLALMAILPAPYHRHLLSSNAPLAGLGQLPEIRFFQGFAPLEALNRFRDADEEHFCTRLKMPQVPLFPPDVEEHMRVFACLSSLVALADAAVSPSLAYTVVEPGLVVFCDESADISNQWMDVAHQHPVPGAEHFSPESSAFVEVPGRPFGDAFAADAASLFQDHHHGLLESTIADAPLTELDGSFPQEGLPPSEPSVMSANGNNTTTTTSTLEEKPPSLLHHMESSSVPYRPHNMLLKAQPSTISTTRTGNRSINQGGSSVYRSFGYNSDECAAYGLTFMGAKGSIDHHE